MSDEVGACPFCGSKYISVIVPVETEYQVQCGNCYASSSIESTEKKAIKAWNCRAPSGHIVYVNKKAENNPPPQAGGGLEMERMTARNTNGSTFYTDCFSEDAPCNCGMLSDGCAGCEMAQKQCDELAAYEDLSYRWNLSIEQMDAIFSRINALGGTGLMAQYRALALSTT